jgi:hypothetical protein
MSASTRWTLAVLAVIAALVVAFAAQFSSPAVISITHHSCGIDPTQISIVAHCCGVDSIAASPVLQSAAVAALFSR